MSWSRVRAALRRFGGLFRRSADDQTLADELAFHIDMETARNARAGMEPDEARRIALVAFGGRAQWFESAADEMRARHVENIAGDVRYALRGLRRNAGFSLTAIAILGLGVGASTVVFRFVDALLLEPLPVRTPRELLEIWNDDAGAASSLERHAPLSYPQFAFLRGNARSFSGMLAVDGEPGLLSWRAAGGAELIRAQFISASAFTVLGVPAVVGRMLVSGDDDASTANRAAVLSYAFWRRRLGGAADVTGRSMTLNGQTFTIAGVAPREFTGVVGGLAPDVWLPLTTAAVVRHDPDVLTSRGSFWLIVIGRLKPGTPAAEAAAELRALYPNFAPGEREREHLTVALFPATLVPGPFRVYVAGFVGLLQVVVLLVLMIACANAVNLFVAQATARRSEMATRTALGATRPRLIQQMLTESILLAVFATVAGAVAAMIVSPLLLRLLPASLPVQLDLTTNWRLVVFVTVLAFASGLALGWIPAVRSTLDLTAAINQGRSAGYRRSRLRNALVVVQVCVSLILLVGSGLCVRSFARARGVSPGFETDHRVAVNLDLKALGYSEGAGQSFYRTLIERASTLPGVTAASIASYLPLETTFSSLSVDIPDQAGLQGPAGFSIQHIDVGPHFFTTTGTVILRGREFESGDDARAPRVVIINDAMAKRFWPNTDPIGRTLRLRGPGANGELAYEIVGIVKTGKYRTLSERPHPMIFRAALQHGEPKAVLVVHASSPAPATLSNVRKVIAELDPNMAIARSGPLEQQLSIALFPARVTSILLGAVGALGLGLALIGIAAIVAYTVVSRTHEIGIRLALGAQRAAIVRDVSGESVRLLVAGLALGLVAALVLTRFLAGVLFGVSTTDAITFIGVSALLFATGIGTTLLVARRAAGIDPVIALRHE